MTEIEELYRESKDKYVRIIRRVLRGNHTLSEDVVQEAFMRAFQYWHSYDPNKSGIKNWFSRILFRELSRVLKKENKHNHVNLDFIKDFADEHDYCKIIEDKASIEDVLQEHFNFKQCLIVMLIYYRGYRIAEIAGMLDISESYVKQVSGRFRKIMRNTDAPDSKENN
jgi:RNA polymerase sigma factor (sigma-70 family)